MKVITVLGARPQFIKAAPVSRAFRSIGLKEVLLHTGQHYDQNMSDIFFEELEIPKPVYNLGLGAASHAKMTGAQMAGIEEILRDEQPDLVLVYGDTNSTLAGALTAAKMQFPVAHVEAGLRSFNRRMPEEINRVVADHVSSILFAPTDTAMGNLAREGIASERCHNFGDVMFDAARIFGERARASSTILQRHGLNAGGFVLATLHRQENTEDAGRLRLILRALDLVGRSIPVLMPVHPRTRRLLDGEEWRGVLGAGVRLVDPVGYLDMVMLVQNAAVIATDSGGLQKEAFFHGVACVTLRDETEWTELVEGGWNRLAPLTDDQGLAEAIISAQGAIGRKISPYGDGTAADKIVRRIASLKL